MENFNAIYKEHSDYIFNLLDRKLFYKDSDLARDLTQDTFIKVAKNLDIFDGSKSKMRTWIVTIAKNVLIDYSRKKQIDIESIDGYVDNDGVHFFPNEPEAKSTPLSDMVNMQIAEGIQLAFSKLPENYKQYAELLFNKQLSYDEIAVELNQPLGTVKASIYRTRELLRETLKSFRS